MYMHIHILYKIVTNTYAIGTVGSFVTSLGFVVNWGVPHLSNGGLAGVRTLIWLFLVSILVTACWVETCLSHDASNGEYLQHSTSAVNSGSSL